MVVVIWIVLAVLAVVCFWWFRRTPLSRAHRRIGVVPGQFGFGAVPGQSASYSNPYVPPLLPELRPDVDHTTPRARRWRMGRNRPPPVPSALAERRRRSLKVLLSERSMRRDAARRLASARRLRVAQDRDLRRESESRAVMADRVRARSVHPYLRRFFSPGEYPRGRVAGTLACVYLAVTVLVIVSAIPEDNGDALTVGLAFVATLPVSLGVLVLHDDGTWMLAALTASALVNGFAIWVAFRGDPAWE
jgi:hypothetical protein